MELELKFALTPQDPRLLQKQLARADIIGAREPQRLQLHNTYYDTPDHALHRAAVALRVRQVGSDAQPQWLQTLKMGGSRAGALSQRGEWESPLASNQLSGSLLATTPWADFDPDGSVSQALVPLFTTRFERLRWEVELRDARVEVALDQGSVEIYGQSTPLCELEIELLSGTPAALFEAAWHISQHLCLLPLHLSKAERAYRLAAGTLDEPLRARPPALKRNMQWDAVVQTVLRESFLQFTANLYSLCHSDSPEVLHQARVGWRRFKSGLQLFKLLRHSSGLPDLAPLRPLLLQMAQVRDLDVAASEVLPSLANGYTGANARRAAQWQRFEALLQKDLGQQRGALRQLLYGPAVGRTLLLMTRWLELDNLRSSQPRGIKKKDATSGWLRQRIGKLADQMQGRHGPVAGNASKAPSTRALHRQRILSKRLRYNIESLRPLLPKKRARHWLGLATQIQTDIGLERDRQLALVGAERLGAARSILDYLSQK